jgi:hypothetical protein
MPYLLLVAGYTLILVIDRVLFDTTEILEGKQAIGPQDDTQSRKGSIALR